MDSSKEFCRDLMDIAIAHGIEYVVASPGSRNTPLLMAATAREELKTIILTDERTAAFVALGISLVERKPVMIFCTSGTALLNYAPAVAEAFYQGIPLVAVSADRPLQWIDQDDSQTLHQFEALHNFVKRSYDIPCENGNPELKWYAERCFNDAMALSVDSKPGPVHINLQLDNPLGKPIERPEFHPRIIEWISSDESLSPSVINSLCEIARNKKILVVAGFMQPSAQLNKALKRLDCLENVFILAETLSNLHLGKDFNAVDSLLSSMNEDDKEMLQPDIVITIGGALVSRMIKDFLRKSQGAQHWTVGLSRNTTDCFKTLSKNIISSPEKFINQFAKGIEKLNRKNNGNSVTGYKERWTALRTLALNSQKHYLEKLEWSEFKAFEKIFKHLPLDFNTFLSNGTPVRYAQLLISDMPHATYCNRGVSGIDGTNATAAGCSIAYKGKTLLLTGDLSFSYDTAILGIRELPHDFKIIVINNGGGGIFRFIGQTRDIENREDLFGQNPSVPIEGIALAYGWDYMKAAGEEEVDRLLPIFFGKKEKTLLEICAPPQYSADVLIDYMNRNK